MKKIGKLMITGMLVCGFLLTVVGCSDDNKPFVPPEPDGSKVSINDAYDWNEDKTGSMRPDTGGDYEPTLPPTRSVVTIAEGSPIRFKDGATSLTLPLGGVLKAEDFDASTLGDHTIGGVGVVSGKYNIGNYVSLSEFAPMSDVSVYPYFSPENGDAYLFGSNKVGDYFYNGDGQDLTEDMPNLLQITNKLVDGFLGKRITCSADLTENAYLRSVTVCEREAAQEYTYYYRFANYGENDLTFTVYQMSGGYNWSDPETAVASEPITLAAGEIGNPIPVKVKETKNDANTLTLIKFDTAVKGFSLGVSMEVKNSTPTVPATITLDLPAGLTISGYETNVRTNDKIKLPTGDQITNNTGHKITHWVYADGTTVVEGKRLTGDVTIKPVLTEDAILTFDLPDGFAISSDYATKLQTGDLLILPTAAQITNDTGRKLIRWLDGEDKELKSGVEVIGDMTIKPELSSPVTIGVQLPSGLTLDASYVKSAQTGDVIVPPTAEQIKGEIADGRQIEGWYVVGDNTVITAKTTYTETEVKLAPFFSRRAGTATMCYYGNEHDGQPLVFSNVQSDNKPLGVYAATDSTLVKESFDAVSSDYENDTAVGGGENGYSELGNVLSYHGKMIKGDAFRCGTKISSDATSNTNNVVKKGVSHTFYYNFENLGEKAVHFTVQGVNTGKTVEGPVTDVKLEPGKSTTVTFTVSYISGSDNKNMIAFFTVQEEITDLKLGVSANVVLNEISASVTLSADVEGFTLKDEYLNKSVHLFEPLTLPVAGEYTDTLSAKRTVTGWQDANGNALENGSVIANNIKLVPIFKYSGDPAAVTYKSVNGVSAENAQTSYKTGDKLTLPAVTAKTTDGRKHLGWYNTATRKTVAAGNIVVESMTLAPYFAPATETALTPLGSGGLNNTDNFTGVDKTNFTEDTDIVVGDEKGIVLHYNGAVAADNAFRFKTAYSLLSGKTYSFGYKFVNYGSEAIGFKVYQVKSGAIIKDMPYKEITLAPGASADAVLALETGENGNALTYFVMTSASENGFDLGITMSVAEVPAAA